MLRRVRQKVSDELTAAFGTAGRLEVTIVRQRADGPGDKPGDKPGDGGIEALPVGTGLRVGYQQARDSLLVLGPAGSGKTVALYELAAHLLAEAERDPAQPIPVVLNLSSWPRHGGRLEPWLADEMTTVYEVPSALAKTWVDDELVLPLLDGLDEVAATARSACAEQVNGYRRRHGLVRLVVCSTAEAYESCGGALRLHEVVELEPLDRARALSHLARAGLHLDAEVQAGTEVEDLLSSPLMLGAVTSAYRGRPEVQLPAGTAQERRERLFAAVLDRAVADQAGRPAAYPPERALDWLAQLARVMRERGESEFRLDLLQPDWLSSRTAQRLALLAPQLVTVAVAFALSFGLYAPVGGSLPALALALAALVLNVLISSQLPPPARFPVEPVEEPGWRPAPARLPSFVQRLLPSQLAAPASADPDHRPGPADGIRRSARQAIAAAAWVLLLLLPPLAVAAAQASAVAAGLAATVTLVCVVVMLPVAMRFGGQACFRHLAVRALLAHEVGVPWRLGRLLDEAGARGLLVRTGSGYRFPHRQLMDYLAGTRVADQVAATIPLATRPSTRKPSITR